MKSKRKILIKKLITSLFFFCVIVQTVVPVFTFEIPSHKTTRAVLEAVNNLSAQLNFIESFSKRFDKNKFNETVDYKNVQTKDFLYTNGNILADLLFGKYIKYISPDPLTHKLLFDNFYLRSPPAHLL